MLFNRGLANFFRSMFSPKKTARNTIFRYFVSYSYTFAGDSNNRNLGCMEIIREKQIQSFEDVTTMVDLIKQTLWLRHNFNVTSVVLLHWQPFEKASQNDA